MDFHSLSRRELQALCKMNKIPANMTNIAMADALKALEFVEGIEELLKPTESEAANSSIESPEKSEITSPSVPRTGCRTTTRRKTAKDEPGTVRTVTRSRRTTTKMLDETPAEAAPTTRRRAAAGSVRRKIEISSKESEEVEKEKKDVPETPAVLTASRRRAVKETSTAKHVYSTRRSTRLAEKNVDEKERSEAIKIDSFAEEMDENLEINLKEGSDEPSEVNNVFDLKASSEEGDAEAVSEGKSDLSENAGAVEVGIEEKEANDMEIDAALTSQVEGRVNVEDEPSDDNKADDDGLEKKPEVDSEMSDETEVHSGDNVEKLLDMENEVQENNGSEGVCASETENAIEKEMKLDTIKDDDSEFVADEILENNVPEIKGRTNNVELESDFHNDMISENQLNQEEKTDTENISQLVMHMDDATGPVSNDVLVMHVDDATGPVSNDVFECENPIKDAKQVTRADITSENVLDAENFTMETSGLQSARGVFLPFFGTASDPTVLPTRTTPVKNSLSTTPMKKSAGRTPRTAGRVTIISDDKENVDSGRKLVFTKEEKPKKKEFVGIKNQKPLEDYSMRQLTKMFKEKLEITKLNKTKEDDIKMETTRPALRTLSENCLVGESQN